jgi:hypothetical protein
VSEQYPPIQEQPTVVQNAEPPGKRRWLLPTLVGIGAFVLGVGVGVVGGEGETDTSPPTTAANGGVTASAAAEAPSPEPPPPPPEPYQPTAADYELTIKTLEKQCFGSAGCNVTFRIELAYVGLESPDPTSTYELTYEVQGGEDPLINTLTVTGDQYSTDESEFISTTSSDAELVAVVQDVTEF